METTLILFKPDCVIRGLVGECLARFERRNFRIAAIATFGVDDDDDQEARLVRHYAEHAGKPFYDQLLREMQAGPVVALALCGPDVVAAARRICGPYADPPPGTIRGDFAMGQMQNTVHSSATRDDAGRELAIWFPGLLPHPG